MNRRVLYPQRVAVQDNLPDHLGSVAMIADQTGAVLQRLSYDAWGARRNPDGTVPVSPITGQTTRGFTGQEAMDALGLINFNARLYDPQLARFLAAGPIKGRDCCLPGPRL